MRGKSQGWLIEANDGRQYVVKFVESGHRQLVNEVVGHTIYRAMDVTTPNVAYVRLDENFLSTHRLMVSQTMVAPGLAFGSEYSGDDRSIYDFLPDSMLKRVVNRSDFYAATVIDRWLCNVDPRQAIFARREIDGQWAASMIDNGGCLGGSAWTFTDSPEIGLYRPAVYGNCDVVDFAASIARLQALPCGIIDDALARVPPAWFGGEDSATRELVRQLHERRGEVPTMIERAVRWLKTSQIDKTAGNKSRCSQTRELVPANV